jgi:nucleoporin SEH1
MEGADDTVVRPLSRPRLVPRPTPACFRAPLPVSARDASPARSDIPPNLNAQFVQGTALETRGEVTATAYDASGTRMVTSTAEGAVHVWDREDDPDEATEGAPGPWRQTAAWAAHENASCEAIAFAPAEFGQCVATAASDGSVRVWREKPLAPLGSDPAAAAEAAAAAAAAAREGAAPWELVADLREARGATTLLDFAPPEHGLQLAAAGADGVVRFYAPENALALLGWELTNEHEALAPGAECAAMAWRRPTAADAARAGAGFSALPPALAVGLAWYDDATEDRRQTSRSSSARVLTYDEGSMRWRVSAVLFEAGAGSAPASALAWAPNADASPSGSAETVAAARGSEVEMYRVALWNFNDSNAEGGDDAYGDRRSLDVTAPRGSNASAPSRLCATLSHPGPVLDLDWNMVGTTLATSAADGVVRVWAANMQTGEWEARAQLVGE